MPLITVLFMASVMLPLFLPPGMNFDKLLRALIGVALFSSAYMAEVVRGGLQAIPRGQYEAADALGLAYWQIDGADHPAAGAEDRDPRHRQQLHRPVQGHDPGLDHRDVRPARHRAGGLPAIRTGRRRRPARPAISRPRYLLGVLLRHVALFACSWSGGSPPAIGADQSHKESTMAEHRSRRQDARSPTRRRHRDHRHAQVVWRLPRAARHQPHGHARRTDRHLRAVGVRQVDADPLHQPPRGAPEGPHHRRRHRAHQRSQEDRRGAPRSRHGVPALQPVPASHRAGELHAGADLGAQDAEVRRPSERR